jgi:hypothetical protein
VAVATVARQNHLSLFSDIMMVIANVDNPEARQKMVKLLEEQWILGLKEERKAKDKAEDAMLVDLAKNYMVLEQHGKDYSAKWVTPKGKK